MTELAQLKNQPDLVQISQLEARQVLAARLLWLEKAGVGDHQHCVAAANKLWPKLCARAEEKIFEKLNGDTDFMGDTC
jgi:hypothetical protein